MRHDESNARKIPSFERQAAEINVKNVIIIFECWKVIENATSEMANTMERTVSGFLRQT
jgi:altronate dehydratase